MSTKTKAPKQPLLHTPISVTLAGETFQITEFPFSKVHMVGAHLVPLLGLLGTAQEGSAVTVGQVMAMGGEGLMHVLAMAVNRPREFIDTLDYEEGKALLVAVKEANANLLKKVMPDLLTYLSEQAPALAKMVEAFHSTNSSQN